MPKLYKEGEIQPYKTKEYYRKKMRHFRANQPKQCNKNVYWTITIDNKKYVFKSKSDINIEKINKTDINQLKDVICF